MLDLGYFDGVNQSHYLFVYVLMFVIVLVAAIWDVYQRRVPNWLWMIGLPLIPAGIMMRHWDVGIAIRETVVIVAIALACYALVRSGAWGMGDAKGITLISLVVGALPGIIIVIMSWAFMPKRIPEQPFFFYVASAMMVVSGLVVTWTIP